MKINNYQINSDNRRNLAFIGEVSEPKIQEKPQVEQGPQKIQQKETPKKFNFPVLLTTITGTILPILVIRKYQGRSINNVALKYMGFKAKAKEILKSFDIEYGLKEMLFTGFGSIAGGLSGGLIFNKDEDKKCKIKESVFQAGNIVIPTSIVAGLLKLTEKCKNPKAILPKIAAVIAGIGLGMPLAAVISNKINNTIMDKDTPCKRKLRVKDCFVHVDDLVGALVLAKIPFADKLHVEQLLPILYGMCGYEVGTQK